MIEVYTDGACEPVNPGGYASYGVFIRVRNGAKWTELMSESKLFVPEKGKEKQTSNNVAEYSGFLRALEWLIQHNLNREEIIYRSDSQLVIYQNSVDPRYGHKWRMKGGYYLPIAKKAQALLPKFKRIKFEWIPREENSIADELSKAELIKAGIEFRIQPEK